MIKGKTLVINRKWDKTGTKTVLRLPKFPETYLEKKRDEKMTKERLSGDVGVEEEQKRSVVSGASFVPGLSTFLGTFGTTAATFRAN